MSTWFFKDIYVCIILFDTPFIIQDAAAWLAMMLVCMNDPQQDVSIQRSAASTGYDVMQSVHCVYDTGVLSWIDKRDGDHMTRFQHLDSTLCDLAYVWHCTRMLLWYSYIYLDMILFPLGANHLRNSNAKKFCCTSKTIKSVSRSAHTRYST